MFDKTLFKSGETIAVALSGGVDSVSLLHILLNNSKHLGISVKAVNVEHGIRGESSENDSLFVSELCKKLNVPLLCYSVNAPEFSQKHGVSLETAARILRYQCFDNALIDGFCDKIATAHHQSDDVETVLFNLLRGSALSGVSGIKKQSENKKIIRPLLSASREELVAFAEKNGYEYVIDESNFDDAPTRNFLRLKVIPLIKTRFPDAEKAIARFADIANEESEYLDNKAHSLISEQQNAILIPDENEFTLFKRAALILLKKIGFKVDYEKQHLDALVNLTKLQTGAKINLKNGIVAYKSYNKIVFETPVFSQNESDTALKISFSLGSFELGNYVLCFKKVQKREKTGLFFDLDKLPGKAVIRLKESGDEITPFKGRKKSLKKYLTDKKIESRVSAQFPLLACGNIIYAVCPVDISDQIKTDENSKNIIKIICSPKGGKQHV